MAIATKKRVRPRLNWPAEVPVLSADDIYKNWFSNDDGTKHCAVGWLRKVSGVDARDYDDADNLVYNRLCEELAKVVGTGEDGIVAWNDEAKPEVVARALNQTFANVGYIVGNPCKPQSKNKRGVK